MKTLFKILGILAGIYGLLSIGSFCGIACCDDYYNKRLNKKSKLDKGIIRSVEANIDLWNDLRKENKRKSSRKRSEILSAHARKWAREGYSSEEIKQGLELLKKELD